MDSKIRRKFHEIRDASNDTKGFAIAVGYWPDASMPFITPQYIANQLEFWKINGCPPPGIVVSNGRGKATKWPDILGNGGGLPGMFLSQKVVDSLDREGIPIFRLTEMPIAEIDGTGLKNIDPPKYYVLEVDPGIQLNYVASQIPLDEHGNPQHRLRPSHFGVWDIGRLETWNGADLFSMEGFPSLIRSRLLCTDRIVELAKRDKWTNVGFEPAWAQ